MIWRSGFMIGCTALAYALLDGWPEALPGVVRACLAVLAWVAGLAVWAIRRKRENEAQARPRRAPRRVDYLALGMAVLAVEGGFLWLLASAPRPLEEAGLMIERRFRPEAAAQRTVGEPDTRPGNWLWTHETRRPLPKRTDFKPGRKPEVFLRLSHPEDSAELLKNKVFVRAFALGRYDGAGWSPLPGSRLVIRADDSGFIPLAPARPGREIVHEVFHAADPNGQNAFTALQGATAASVSPLERVDDGLFLLPAATSAGGYQYTAKSRPVRIEDLPDGALTRAWPGAADELLALPEDAEFEAALRSLSRTAAGSGTVEQQLLSVQDHLRASFGYSLTTTNSRNLDPMVNFLFEEKRGHCEYFATAGALMARALGLPSRVAYGWAGGTWHEESGLFVFRANEAHAWTEIWLETHGWVMMDPTPNSSETGARAQVAPPGQALPGLEESDSPADLTETTAGVPLPQLGLWLMLGFGLAAGLIAVFRTSRRFREDLPDRMAGETADTPGYLKLWHRACVSRGIPLKPGFTLRHQLSRMPDAPEFAAEMCAYHYATRYEGRAHDERLEQHLARRIREWESGFSGINPPHHPPMPVHE